MSRPVRYKKGEMISSANFNEKWWRFPRRDRIAEILNLDAEIDNDANAAALGEGWVGSARNARDFLVLTLGSGIGGGGFRY